jgi:hypothetical protein
MDVRKARYSKEEAARRGDELYDRDIRPQLEPEHNGNIVAIDLDSGAWEVDADEATAMRRLKSRCSEAEIWAVRIGSRYLTRFGAGRGTRAG